MCDRTQKRAGILAALTNIISRQGEKKLLGLVHTSQRAIGDFVKIAEPKVQAHSDITRSPLHIFVD